MGKGGGSSGAVSYPAYMQAIHGDWLDNNGVDSITSSITDLMNSAIGNSPWTGQTAYDPDTDIAAMVASGGDLQDLVTLLSTGTTLDTIVSNILSSTYIDNVVTEYAADLDARLASEVLPRFERGMQDINMVVSSAFVVGRALIEQNQDRQLAKFSADLHLKSASDDAFKIIQLKLEYQKIATQTIIELNRIKIVAKKEENDVDMDIDERDAKWDMEVFQYGGNVLASVAGASSGTKGPSTAQTALGGAMTGAATGAVIAMASKGAIAGPVGIAAGAALGLASAFL